MAEIGTGESEEGGAGLNRVRRRETGPFRKQFATHVRDWGLRRALHWAVMRVLARLFGLHVHYVSVSANRPDLADPNVPVVPPGYTFRLVGLADLMPYAGQVPGLSEAFLERAFQVGNEIVSAAFYGAELVALNFNTRCRTPVTDQLDVLIPKGFSYGYKSWTHPDHTRRNLQKMLGYLERNEGQWPFEERSIWYVETHNYASLLHGYTHPSARSLPMGFAGWFTWFGREVPFNTRQAKKIGFEFVRKDDPARRQYIR